MTPWIGVDLDGTLAYYESGHFAKYGPYHIGEPIPRMVERVKEWLAQGIEVRIVTARAYGAELQTLDAILAWCLKHIGARLAITCVKDYGMIELWDDRAVQVIPNTGIRADAAAVKYCRVCGKPENPDRLHGDYGC